MVQHNYPKRMSHNRVIFPNRSAMAMSSDTFCDIRFLFTVISPIQDQRVKSEASIVTEW